MREELEDVLELYAGMPPEGQEHWRARSLPAVRFDSKAEREQFLAALRERDRQPSAPGGAGAPRSETVAPKLVLRPGQRVKVNLAGLTSGGVTFSQNVEAALATVEDRVSADPPIFHVRLLIAFRGVTEVDVPADRIRPL